MVAEGIAKALFNVEKIKVWSLIVTLFGDLGRSSSQSLTGKQINSLLSHIGIKPEATRVALHRLKKEGWIETSKSGRETVYAMSEKAKRETVQVYDDVYGENNKFPEGWCLCISHEKEVKQDENRTSIEIARNINLVPVSEKKKGNDCVYGEIDKDSLPEWLSNILVPEQTQAVISLLGKASGDEGVSASHNASYDTFAVRLLVLHHWRKLALRDATWCYIWLYPDSNLSQCQRKVVGFLARSAPINSHALASQ